MDYHFLMTFKDVDLISVTEPDVNSLRLFFSRRKTSATPSQ
jgi:hypothetical protein